MLAVPCWLTLAGCSAAPVWGDVEASVPAHRHAQIPARKLRALLAQPSPPNCEYKGPEADGLDADLWERIKLDYERHCYQRAEATLRSRLRALQVSGLCELRPVAHRQRFLRAAPSF